MRRSSISRRSRRGTRYMEEQEDEEESGTIRRSRQGGRKMSRDKEERTMGTAELLAKRNIDLLLSVKLLMLMSFIYCTVLL